MKTIIINRQLFDVSDESYAFIILAITNSNYYQYIIEEANGFVVSLEDVKTLCDILSICVTVYSGFLFERLEYLKDNIKYQFYYYSISANGELAKSLLDNGNYEPALNMLLEIFRMEMFMENSFNYGYCF